MVELGHRNPFFFFLNDPATTEIYPLPLPHPLPISLHESAGGSHRRATAALDVAAVLHRHFLVGLDPAGSGSDADRGSAGLRCASPSDERDVHRNLRSEEHTSELQSQSNLVCRLLLE